MLQALSEQFIKPDKFNVAESNLPPANITAVTRIFNML